MKNKNALILTLTFYLPISDELISGAFSRMLTKQPIQKNKDTIILNEK